MNEPEQHEHDDADDAERADFPPAPVSDEEAEHEEADHEREQGDAQEQDTAATTPEAWEKRFTFAERRFKSYRVAIEKEWAEDALHLVPFNLDPGAPPGYIDTRNAGHVEDETRTAALAFLGMHAEAEMRDDPYSVTCSTCAGWGQVKTGSIVPNMEVRDCLDCTARGYIATQTAEDRGVTPPAPAAEGGNGHVVPAAIGPESPEVQALRLRGYTVVPPMPAPTS